MGGGAFEPKSLVGQGIEANCKKKAFTLAEVSMPKRTSGINNEVMYSRESKAKEPFSLNKKSAAFTLAEVLVTLAIIGVVAALTIPVVVAKYQQKVFILNL